MSLGGGKSDSDSSSMNQASGNSSSNSTFNSANESATGANYNQNIWGGQSPALQSLYQQAGNVFQNQYPELQNQITNASNNMNQVTNTANPYWEQQMQGGAYNGMELQNKLDYLMANGADTGNTSRIYANIMGGEGNNYADAMREQYVKDATRAQENMLKNLDQRAAAAGMSGGSRQGVATALGMRDINDNLQSEMAKIGYNTFDKDLQNKLKIAELADQNALARYQGDQNTLTGLLNSLQQTMNTGLNNTTGMQELNMGQFAPGMVPYAQLGQYANVLGSPTLLSNGSQFGSSSGTQEGLQNAINKWQAMGTASSDSKSGGIGI